MSQSQLLAYGNAAIQDNLTRFLPLVGRLSTSAAADANVECAIRDAGTLAHLYARAPTNTATGPSTVTLRVNAVDTALTVSFGASEVGVKEDTSNTVAVVDGDEACWKVVVPTEAGTRTLTLSVLGCSFTPTTTTNCVALLQTSGSDVVNSASATRFAKLQGITNFVAAETNEKFRIRNVGASRDLSVLVSANARTTDTVFKTRLNGADGAQAVTFGNVETGRKDDATNSDTLAVGDDLNLAVTTGTGTQSLTVQTITTTYVSTNGVFPLLLSSDGVAQAFNVTTFYGLAGDLDIQKTTEDDAELVPRFDFTLKELSALCSANTITTSATLIRVRVNGADGNQSLSYAAAETGLKTDTVNTDALTGGTTTTNFSVVTPNTSGSFTLHWIAVWGEVAAAALVQGWYPSYPSSVVVPLPFQYQGVAMPEFVPPASAAHAGSWYPLQPDWLPAPQLRLEQTSLVKEPPAAPTVPDLSWQSRYPDRHVYAVTPEFQAWTAPHYVPDVTVPVPALSWAPVFPDRALKQQVLTAQQPAFTIDAQFWVVPTPPVVPTSLVWRVATDLPELGTSGDPMMYLGGFGG